MNTHTRHLLSSLEALFNVTVKQADRHGLDEIRISKARAKELLTDIIIAKKEVERPTQSTAHFTRLDQIFGLQDA